MVIGGYLLGSLLPAELAARAMTGRSVLEQGDNPGAAGAWRKAGWLAGVIVALLDAAKGAVPVAIALYFNFAPGWLVLSAVAPVAGHAWPIFSGFRGGGRALAPASGALAWLAFPQVLAAYVLGALVAWRVKWVPAVGVVGFPVGLLLMVITRVPGDLIIAAVAVMLVVLVRQVPWVITQLARR